MSQFIRKIRSIENYNCSYLTVTNNVLLNWRKYERELWSVKGIASKICNESNYTKMNLFEKQQFSPFCYQWRLIESTKQWIIVMQYEGECIDFLMSRIIQKLHLFERQKCSYFTATNNIKLQQQNNERDWCIIKVPASKYSMSQIIRKLH